MAVAYSEAAVPREQAQTGRGAPGPVAISALVTFGLAVALFVLYALWEFWPTEAVIKTSAASPVRIVGIDRLVSPDVRLLVVVALAGALGALMHSTRSLAWYVGHKELVWRWIPYYLVTIVIGAGLASIFYLVLRGGILGDRATTADTNPYGFAAIAALVGLFTEQALAMLRGVAHQVFAAAPRGANAVQPGTNPLSAAAGRLAARTGGAANVTADSATLEGSATTEGLQTSCHFDYGTTAAYGETTPAQFSDGAAQAIHVSAAVSGLAPDTSYHFRLVVADASGQWTTGDDATFTTAAG